LSTISLGLQLKFCLNICDHLSENLHSSHKMYIEEKQNLKIICKIMHATGKYLQGLMRSAISKRKLQINKIYITGLNPGMSARGDKTHFIREKGGAMLFVRVTKIKISLYGGLG